MWGKSDWARSPGTCTCSKMISRSGPCCARHCAIWRGIGAHWRGTVLAGIALAQLGEQRCPEVSPGPVVMAPRPTASPRTIGLGRVRHVRGCFSWLGSLPARSYLRAVFTLMPARAAARC
jgi:hypothetical protein